MKTILTVAAGGAAYIVASAISTVGGLFAGLALVRAILA